MGTKYECLSFGLSVGRKYGITELGPDVINFVSHATQQRLQNLLEKVSEVSQQKNIYYKVKHSNTVLVLKCWKIKENP